MKESRIRGITKHKFVLGLAMGAMLLSAQQTQANLVLAEDFNSKPGGVMTVNANSDNVAQYAFSEISSSFYISTLIKFSGALGQNDFGGIYFNNQATGLGIGIKGNQDTSDPNREDLFARLSVGGAAYDQNIQIGTWYQIVAKFTRSGNGYDSVQLWVNPSNEGSSSTTKTLTSSVVINPNVLKFRGANLDSGDAVVFDRLRVGTEFSDVAPVPEPATILAGALLLLPFGASTLRAIRKKV